MAEESVPFDSGPGAVVDEAGWRRMARGFARDGLILPVTAEGQITAGGGASVTRAACPVGFIVDGFHYRDTASSNKAVTANGSSSPRRDRAVLRLDPAANKVSWEVKLGAPAASPVAPALTQDRTGIWEVPLASWTMPGAAASQIPASFTDERPRPAAASLGEVARATRAANAGPVTALTVISGLTASWVNPFGYDRRVRVLIEPASSIVNAVPSAGQVQFYRNGTAFGAARANSYAGANNGQDWTPSTAGIASPGVNDFTVALGNYSGASNTFSMYGPISLTVVDLGAA